VNGKQSNNNDNAAKQNLTSEATGLSVYELNVLKTLMAKARKAFNEKKYELSEDFCRQCIDIYPDYAAPFAVLGRIAVSFQKFELAATYFERSLDILPEVPGRLLFYSIVLTDLNRQEEALAAVDKCLDINPNLIQAISNRAKVLDYLGRTDEAIAVYERLMLEAPLYGKAFHSFSTLHKFVKGDKYSLMFERLTEDISSIGSESGLVDAHFALGKYFEDLEDYKTGFQNYLTANEMMSNGVDYEIEKDFAMMDRQKARFPKGGAWLNETESGCKSDVPVFIVGMPRSGTTLIEQILASHSVIHGAGELTLLQKHVDGCSIPSFGDKEVESIDLTNSIQFRKQLSQSAKELADEIIAKKPDAKHIVDKMPQNFLLLGYKHLFLPNAKVIHCKRNPIDTCLSNFRLQFNGKLHFTTDLANLGKYYVAYAQLMEHWKEILPDQILEVEYENVVDDVETQARRIIDFLGLEWEEECLQFYKHKRSVNTASFVQVRQPIYKSSIGRHERYGDFLNPLIEALQPVL